MADVRSAVGAATTGVFAGNTGNQVGTPAYINLANGDLSFLLPGDVIFTINIASIILQSQIYGKHNIQSAYTPSVSDVLMQQSLAHRITPSWWY